MNIAVIGTGYVGLVTGVSLSLLGHTVFCIGRDKEKINKINKGKAPFYEPGLSGLVFKMTKKKKLIASDNFYDSVKRSQIVIIAVGTPTVNNKIDLSALRVVSEQIGKAIQNTPDYKVIVVKSTVVPTTTEKVVLPLIEKYSEKKLGSFGLCMSPEFLREGNAVEDSLSPDRIVIGANDQKSMKTYVKVFSKVKCPKIFVGFRTAELIKYASNALLATMISYSNEIARISEEVGEIDVVDVWKGVHLDGRLSPKNGKKRIKPGFLSYILSGAGYGGSCFPKDTKALSAFAKELQIEPYILEAVIKINTTQPERIIKLLKKSLGNLKGKRIAVLGLSFKPDTDDMRESPSLALVSMLQKEGAFISSHDPQVYVANEKLLKKLPIKFSANVEDALGRADAAVIMTAWDEYRKISPKIFENLMKNPLVVDGRRIYNKNNFKKTRVTYRGIGYA